MTAKEFPDISFPISAHKFLCKPLRWGSVSLAFDRSPSNRFYTINYLHHLRKLLEECNSTTRSKVTDFLLRIFHQGIKRSTPQSQNEVDVSSQLIRCLLHIFT